MSKKPYKQGQFFPPPIKAEQYPFDFPTLQAQSFDDFAVGNSNKQAVQQLTIWPNWAHHVMLIVGPQACGKSHLLHSFQKQYGGIFVKDDDFNNFDKIMSNIKENDRLIFIVDNADTIKNQNGLFHLFNAIKENQGWLLLSARKTPNMWDFKLEDLASRIKSTPFAEISMPDEALLKAVLIKLFSDRQLLVDEKVISFLITRMERSFESALVLVDIIDKAALNAGKNITVPLVRDSIEQYEEAFS